jgi:hypothetical protein
MITALLATPDLCTSPEYTHTAKDVLTEENINEAEYESALKKLQESKKRRTRNKKVLAATLLAGGATATLLAAHFYAKNQECQKNLAAFYGAEFYDRDILARHAPSEAEHEPCCIYGKTFYTPAEIEQNRPKRLTQAPPNLDPNAFNLYQTLVAVENKILQDASGHNWIHECTCGKVLPTTPLIIEEPEPTASSPGYILNKQMVDLFNLIIPNAQAGRCAQDAIRTGYVLTKNASIIQHYTGNPHQLYYAAGTKRSYLKDLNDFRHTSSELLTQYIHNIANLIQTRIAPNALTYKHLFDFCMDNNQTNIAELLTTLAASCQKNISDYSNFLTEMTDTFKQHHGASARIELKKEADRFTLLFMSRVIQTPIIIWEVKENETLKYKGVLSPYFALRNPSSALGIEKWVHLTVILTGYPHVECMRISEFMDKIENNSVDTMKTPLRLPSKAELKKIRRTQNPVEIVDKRHIPVDSTPPTSFKPSLYTQHTDICIKGKTLYSLDEIKHLLASTESSVTPTTDLQPLLIQLERHILTEATTKNYSEMCTCGFEDTFKEGDYLFPEPLTYATYLRNQNSLGSWLSPYKKRIDAASTYADITINISCESIKSKKLLVPNHNIQSRSKYRSHVIESILIGNFLSMSSTFTEDYNAPMKREYYDLFITNQKNVSLLSINCLHNNIIKAAQINEPFPGYSDVDTFLDRTARYDLKHLLTWMGLNPLSSKNYNQDWWEQIYTNFIRKCEDYTYKPTIFTVFFMSQLLQKPIVIWEKIQDGSLIYSKICSPYFALLEQNPLQRNIEQWIHIAISTDQNTVNSLNAEWETSECLNFKDVMASLRPPE